MAQSSSPSASSTAAAGGASSTAAAKAAAAAAPKFSNTDFVYHIDLFLICLFGLYVLTTLPRAIARYSYTHGFFQGLILRSGSPKPSNSPYRSNTMRSTASRATLGNGSDESHTYASHANLVHKGNEANFANNRPPTRVPRWATVIHPLVSYCLNKRVAAGFSVGKVIISLAYTAVVFYAAFYGPEVNPFSDSVRAGFVGTSQIPIVIALANKNNALSYLCGLGYEKVRRFFVPCACFFR